jgi:hypothetical protein
VIGHELQTCDYPILVGLTLHYVIEAGVEFLELGRHSLNLLFRGQSAYCAYPFFLSGWRTRPVLALGLF